MNWRFTFVSSALLAAVLFASGCKTARPKEAISKPRTESEEAKPRDTSTAESKKIASAHAHYTAGVVYEINDETEKALAEYRQAAAEDPDDQTLILQVSRRFMEAKQFDKALEILQAAAARPNAGGEIFARMAVVYAQQGKKEEALAANRTVLKKSPNSLTAYQNLFAYHLQNKQPEDALKILDEASKRTDADGEFLIALADLYRNYTLQFPTQRDAINPRAAAVLLRAKALKPAKPQARLRLAEGLYALGKMDEAAPLYLGLLNEVEDLPLVIETVRSRLADIYLKDKDSARAREQLEAIIKADPVNAQAYYFLGSIAYEEKNWTNAVEYLKKTLLFRPNFEQAYYDLAAAQLALNKGEDASETLRSARKRFSGKFISEYLSGLASQHLKNYADAVTHFTAAEVLAKAGETNALTAGFYFEVGIAHERSGNREEAVKYFEKALELQPDFPEVQNYLGYMWAERGENLERAKDLIEKAVKAEPKSAAYLDSMAWVLFKLNQPKPALDYMLKAVELTEEPDATLYDHLGDIYAALKETKKARDSWRKSLGVEKSEAVQKKLDAAAP